MSWKSLQEHTHRSHQNGKDQEEDARRHPSRSESHEEKQTRMNFLELNVKLQRVRPKEMLRNNFLKQKKSDNKTVFKNIIRISCQKARVSTGDQGIKRCKGVMATGQENIEFFCILLHCRKSHRCSQWNNLNPNYFIEDESENKTINWALSGRC